MDIEEIILRLKDRESRNFHGFCIVPASSVETGRSITIALECKSNLAGREITLQVGLPSRFPYVLPFVFLKERNIFAFLVPHLEEDGYICYLSSEGLLLNTNKPDDIINEALELALHVLEESLSGRNRNDLYNEFEAFWRRIRVGETKRVASLVQPTTKTGYKKFYVWSLSKESKAYPDLLFSETLEDGKHYAKQVFSTELLEENVHNGYFLMLRPRTFIDLDKLRHKFNPKAIRQILKENLTSSVSRRFFKYIKYKTVSADQMEYLLLGVPQPDGNISLIGVEYMGFRPQPNKGTSRLKHPLNESLDYNVTLTALTVERHYQEHLVLRTGGQRELIDKRIAVLGVGAVGSRIAGELIHAGVRELTLIDNDTISPDNLYRHEVGTIYLYYNKARAVSNHLKYKYPMTKIDYKDANVYDLLTSCPDIFEKYDLIVASMGNPTVEMLLNQRIRELENPPSLIFAWVEPLGIGGHAIATLNNSLKGCYECLHTNPSGPTFEYINRASFAAPRQIFTKTVAGCGTQFTPYGSVDALQTAILATRLAINILTGQEQDNPLLSWKGDATIFIQSGFLLSPRYELTNEELFQSRYMYKTNRCPTCCNNEMVTK